MSDVNEDEDKKEKDKMLKDPGDRSHAGSKSKQSLPEHMITHDGKDRVIIASGILGKINVSDSTSKLNDGEPTVVSDLQAHHDAARTLLGLDPSSNKNLSTLNASLGIKSLQNMTSFETNTEILAHPIKSVCFSCCCF